MRKHMQGIFDIIGPIMIGPSSSHTAGAARLALMARRIFGKEPKRVTFYLHGSFAKTYVGHGSDKALLAGILGFRQDDIRLKSALELATEKGIHYTFIAKDLGNVHPNTVLMVLSDEQSSMEIQGSSLGGGAIVISRIDEFLVDISGEYNSLMTIHQDRLGYIAAISAELAKLKVNVAFMRVSREGRGKRALMVVELDDAVPVEAIPTIKQVVGLEKVMIIPALI